APVGGHLHLRDRLGRVGGVHHLAVADVHPDVGRAAVEEDQVARLQVVVGDRGAGVDPVVGGAGQAQPGLAPGRLDQAGAVPHVGAVGAEAVGVADLGVDEVDGGLGVPGGRAVVGGAAGGAAARGARGRGAAVDALAGLGALLIGQPVQDRLLLGDLLLGVALGLLGLLQLLLGLVLRVVGLGLELVELVLLLGVVAQLVLLALGQVAEVGGLLKGLLRAGGRDEEGDGAVVGAGVGRGGQLAHARLHVLELLLDLLPLLADVGQFALGGVVVLLGLVVGLREFRVLLLELLDLAADVVRRRVGERRPGYGRRSQQGAGGDEADGREGAAVCAALASLVHGGGPPFSRGPPTGRTRGSACRRCALGEG